MRINKSCVYQPDELDFNLIENSHEEATYPAPYIPTPPKKIKLMISGETMQCRKVRQILRHQVPNKILSLEKFAHFVLLLFHPFKDEKELLSIFSPMYQNKLQEEGA